MVAVELQVVLVYGGKDSGGGKADTRLKCSVDEWAAVRWTPS